MSKQTRPLLSLLVLAALLSLGGLSQPSSASRPAQQASVTNSTARNAAIVATTAEVLKATSEIRQLAILRPVKSGAQARDAIERMLIKNLDEQTTTAEMHANEVTMRKFGLVPADFEYRPFIIKLLTEQVAGYYDVKVREFYLADWLELDGQKPVMAHELTHALQDQHFNLKRFEKWPKNESDSELAARALIEGDATLAMTIYMTRNPLEALAFTKTILSSGIATEQINKAPRAMRESLVFPYLEGSGWATQLYKRGGWNMVSQAFNRLPLSTEQILHPDKYFSYEQPVKIHLPDVTNVLNEGHKQPANGRRQTSVGSEQWAVGSRQFAPGKPQFNAHAGAGQAPVRRKGTQLNRSRRVEPKPPAPTPNPQPSAPTTWRRIDYDVNGEWGYYLILDQFLKAPADSRRASAGWAGDRYAVYEGPRSGDVLLAQMTAWDTENDAREFFDAYVKRTELRYSGAESVDFKSGDSESSASKTEIRTPNSEIQKSNTRRFHTGEGLVVIELRGSRVLVLEGIPPGVDPNSLTRALWS